MIQYRADLHKLFPNISECVCAEIGVAEGLFSRDILNWGIKKLYLVDLWESHPEIFGDVGFEQEWHTKNYANVKRLMEPFGEKAELLRGPSVAMSKMVPDESLDLVYIDACHDFQNVTWDLEAWFPKVKKGGIIAGHDWNFVQLVRIDVETNITRRTTPVQDAVNAFSGGKFALSFLAENAFEDAGYYFYKP